MKQFTQFPGAAMTALSLAAFHAPAADTSSTPAMQLKLYRVPAQQSAVIERTLHAMLAGNTLGKIVKDRDYAVRVTEPFPGTVAALVSRQMRDSIGDAIRQLPSGQANVRLCLVQSAPRASNAPRDDQPRYHQADPSQAPQP